MASAAPAQIRCGVTVCIPSGIGFGEVFVEELIFPSGLGFDGRRPPRGIA
jgi:hypothetical protein